MTTPEHLTPLLTAKEVARYFRVHEATVRRAIKRGELPAIRTGSRVRISAAALGAYEHSPPSVGK